MRAALVAGGWLWAAAIVWLSLTPSPPEAPGLPYADKIGHFLAYTLLMLWFAALYRARRARLAYAVLWIGMGVALEFTQLASGYRDLELADMAANSLGVLLGWGLSATLRA